MKWVYRLTALSLLLMAALVTLARRDSSGAWIAFAAVHNDAPAIFLMTGDGGSVQNITPDVLCASGPRWSPDGKWITFQNLCRTTPEILRVRVGGSTARVLSTGVYHWLSPDGARLLVWRAGYGYYTMNLDGSGERYLGDNDDFHIWSADSAWIYTRRYATDLIRIHAETGHIETVIPDRNLTPASWSPDGMQLLMIQRGSDSDKLFVMRHGTPREIQTGLPPVHFFEPQWSPDGEWIAFMAGGSFYPSQIYRMRADGSDAHQVIGQSQRISRLQWSPDGEWLLFHEIHGGGSDILRVRVDGSIIENLTPGPGESYAAQYAPLSGLEWRPFWVTIAALGMMLLSLMRRFYP